jgi:hypothetical protein
MENLVTEQLSKTVGTTTFLAWKKIGLKDPETLDSYEWFFGGDSSTSGDLDNYVEPEGSVLLETDLPDLMWLPEGQSAPLGYEAYNMTWAHWGAKKGQKERLEVCAVCDDLFPISQLTKINGKYYCEEDAK